MKFGEMANKNEILLVADGYFRGQLKFDNRYALLYNNSSIVAPFKGVRDGIDSQKCPYILSLTKEALEKIEIRLSTQSCIQDNSLIVPIICKPTYLTGANNKLD